MEMRAGDLEWVSSVRSAREKAVARSSEGQLSVILHSAPSDLAQQVYVVKLLDVHPRLGKVAGRRLLDDMGISHFARVSDLTASQIISILQACGESS